MIDKFKPLKRNDPSKLTITNAARRKKGLCLTIEKKNLNPPLTDRSKATHKLEVSPYKDAARICTTGEKYRKAKETKAATVAVTVIALAYFSLGAKKLSKSTIIEIVISAKLTVSEKPPM